LDAVDLQGFSMNLTHLTEPGLAPAAWWSRNDIFQIFPSSSSHTTGRLYTTSKEHDGLHDESMIHQAEPLHDYPFVLYLYYTRPQFK
jgi:hypothetical protein